jgi:hypothetical protein
MSESDYQRATTQTAANLRSVAKSLSSKGISRLSLPEIDAVIELTSKVIPAGNVPGMILTGLARLPGKKPPLQKMRQDITSLFRGVEHIRNQAVYSTFFAGPAAIIWGYQNLLKLAGKDTSEAFPEGIWQFYADYALREDTARHANETLGFDALLQDHNIRLNEVDRLTAWVMASSVCMHQYDEFLENEWRERISIALLQNITRTLPDAGRYNRLYPHWEAVRPYRRDSDAASLNYPTYRKRKFDAFIEDTLQALPQSVYSEWEAKMKEAIQRDLPAYQRQMSILAYLEPGSYGEDRVPFEITQSWIGIIHRDNYYLIPACEPGTDYPLEVTTAREQITAILALQSEAPARLSPLARVQRASLPNLYRNLDSRLVKELEILQYAPILINTTTRSRALPLVEIRSAERGVGSHPLTLFDTGESFVFDQSHIFFDGTWGAALAEIMTNEALSWAVYLNMLPPAERSDRKIYTALEFDLQPDDYSQIRGAPQVAVEASAESDAVNLKACQALRKLFKRRNDLIQLTINDLLILYRSIHAVTYKPSPGLKSELDQLAKNNPEIAAKVRHAFSDAQKTVPGILIPIDASRRDPKARIYPLNIEVPLVELDILGLHAQAIQALNDYEMNRGDRTTVYTEFDRVQRIYLASLAGFGTILKKAREIAIQGESASVGALKMLAHLPTPLQRLLDKLPDRFELLSDLLKGKEVFSNIGQVAPTSTLVRFISAKDDNDQKQMTWGVLTDAAGVMHISLRDFRPHVASLHSINRKDLANLIAQDYLDEYATNINIFIKDLWRITQASRETDARHGSGNQVIANE